MVPLGGGGVADVPLRARKACEFCRGRRIKCLTAPGATSCNACLSRNKVCVMEPANSKQAGEVLTEGDVNALGPMAMLRHTYMNGAMSPAQLSLSAEKMTAELKVYKEMADYYQKQMAKLTQGLLPIPNAKVASSGPVTRAISAPAYALQSVVINPPELKDVLYSNLSTRQNFGEENIRFLNGGSEMILEGGRVVKTREVVNRLYQAYVESLVVVACGESTIPLPEEGLVEMFTLLSQPLIFNDVRAPEDSTEEALGKRNATSIETSEDAPLDALLDLWEHAYAFSHGALTLGAKGPSVSPNSSASSPQTFSPSTPTSSSSSSTQNSNFCSPQNFESSSSTNQTSSSHHQPQKTSMTSSTTSSPQNAQPKNAFGGAQDAYNSMLGGIGLGLATGGTSSASNTSSKSFIPSATLNAISAVMSSNCEKLMRVVIFRREAHTQEKYAERLVRALIGMCVYYRKLHKLGAASSLLMIAHQIIATFPAVIPPVTSDRIYVLLLLGATTEHERKEWLHMLHDQIHFTASILLSYNVGFIVSKLRTNPVMTAPVLEEISLRLSELENLLPTLNTEMALFHVWVKILIACFHGELGARTGDMDRAALALSRIEELVIENYSSSIAIVLLAELRNFAQYCSPCSVVLNGKEQVLCHYVIDRVQAIHDERSSVPDPSPDSSYIPSENIDTSNNNIKMEESSMQTSSQAAEKNFENSGTFVHASITPSNHQEQPQIETEASNTINSTRQVDVGAQNQTCSNSGFQSHHYLLSNGESVSLANNYFDYHTRTPENPSQIPTLSPIGNSASGLSSPSTSTTPNLPSSTNISSPTNHSRVFGSTANNSHSLGESQQHRAMGSQASETSQFTPMEANMHIMSAGAGSNGPSGLFRTAVPHAYPTHIPNPQNRLAPHLGNLNTASTAQPTSAGVQNFGNSVSNFSTVMPHEGVGAYPVQHGNLQQQTENMSSPLRTLQDAQMTRNGQILTSSNQEPSIGLNYDPMNDWEYMKQTTDPDMLSNWSANQNRLNLELFGDYSGVPDFDPDMPQNF